MDEAWFASRAWALISTGYPVGTLDLGVVDTFDGYWTAFPFVLPWLQSLLLRLTGLSLFSVRLFSLLFGLILLGAVYVIGLRSHGRLAGLLSVVLVSVSGSFLYSSHLGRPDIAVAALGFAAVALCLSESSAGLPIRSTIAGLCVTAAFDAHMNGMLYGFAVLGLLLALHGRSVLGSRSLWGFLAGVSAGLVAYAAIHILPYPETYTALTKPGLTDWRPPPLLSWDLAVWLAGFSNTLVLLLASSGTTVLLAIIACVVLLGSHRHSDWALPVSLAVLFVSMSLIIRYKLLFYGILISPLVDILAAVLIAKAVQDRWVQTRLGRFGLAAIAAMVIAAATISLPRVANDPMPEYQAAVAAIDKVVAPGSTVIGIQRYWFGIPDRRYLSLETLSAYTKYFPGATISDALNHLRPNYIILDGHSDMYIAYPGDQVAENLRFIYIPKDQLEAFLAHRGRLAAEVSTQNWGTMRVHSIDWLKP